MFASQLKSNRCPPAAPTMSPFTPSDPGAHVIKSWDVFFLSGERASTLCTSPWYEPRKTRVHLWFYLRAKAQAQNQRLPLSRWAYFCSWRLYGQANLSVWTPSFVLFRWHTVESGEPVTVTLSLAGFSVETPEAVGGPRLERSPLCLRLPRLSMETWSLRSPWSGCPDSDKKKEKWKHPTFQQIETISKQR